MDIHPVVLIVWVLALVVGTLVGAVVLRAAVSLYNYFAGGSNAPGAVPEPAFGKAVSITLLQFGASFMLSLILRIPGIAVDSGSGGASVVAQLFAIPASLLAMAAVLTGMLPTSFGRSLVVTLCYLLVTILLCALFFLIFVAVSLAIR